MSEERKFHMPPKSPPPHMMHPHPHAFGPEEIPGAEITRLSQEVLAGEADTYKFTHKNYTLTEPIIIGDGKTLEIKRGAVLTIRDGGALLVTGSGKLINNSLIYIKEGGSVSDEKAKLQGLFGEGYWRIMKGGSFTIGGVKIASPDGEGAFARVNSGWLSVQHRELETKHVNLMVSGSRDEPGDVFFYRFDPTVLFDVEGKDVRDRSLALNVTRNSTATIMGEICLTREGEGKVNGTIYVNDTDEGDGSATFVVSNMPDTFSFGKIEARRQGILGLNVHAPLGMEFIIHKDAALYSEEGCVVEPLGGKEANLAFTQNVKFTMTATPDKWHVSSFLKDEEAEGEAIALLLGHNLRFEFGLEVGEDVCATLPEGKEIRMDGGVLLVGGTLNLEGSGRIIGVGKIVLGPEGTLKRDGSDWTPDPDSGMTVERIL